MSIDAVVSGVRSISMLRFNRSLSRVHLAIADGRAKLAALAERWQLWAKTQSPLRPLPPARTGVWSRIGLGLTLLLMVAYTIIFIAYVFALQSTLLTHAEDMGIMDQVFWNTIHGHFWHQTICNSVSDSNCLGDVSRWGIHFEPSMVLLVPIYWVAPGPRTLLAIQVVGVALGALPAYWLASRRLGHPFMGVLLALAYLTMPVLASAVASDFHMVTLAAPALMFAIYFLYARNDRGFWIAALLAMGTKEQIPIDVAMLGLAAILLQGRWRFGLQVIAASAAWAIVALTVIHMASPVGISPTADRYNSILATLERLPQVIQDPLRRQYLITLISNTGYLGLLAPWVLALAAPSALLNDLSTDTNQYSGKFQYNADIAPFLLLSAIEGIALAWWLLNRGVALLQWLMQTAEWKRFQAQIRVRAAHVQAWLAASLDRLEARVTWLKSPRQHLAVAGDWLKGHSPLLIRPLLVYVTFQGAFLFMLQQPQNRLSVVWPSPTAHTKLAQHFFHLIPTAASVSAQEGLVPHLSHRRDIYQYPDELATAQYVLLDMTANEYPEPDENSYAQAVEATLDAGLFSLVQAQDGYILLDHAPPTVTTPVIVLPQSFCPTETPTNPGAWVSIEQVSSCIVPH
jgi:uncharacterized membrane protein